MKYWIGVWLEEGGSEDFKRRASFEWAENSLQKYVKQYKTNLSPRHSREFWGSLTSIGVSCYNINNYHPFI